MIGNLPGKILSDMKIEIHDNDEEHKPVPGLKFKDPEFIMMSMGHIGDLIPYIEEEGKGVYNIEGIKPTMGGDWRLKIIFNENKDTCTFDLWSVKPEELLWI